MEHHGFHFFKLKRCIQKGSIHYLVCLGNFCIHKFLEISPQSQYDYRSISDKKRLLMGVGASPSGRGGGGGGRGNILFLLALYMFIFIYLKSPVFHILQSTFYFTGVELTVAQGLMKRMQNEGFLRQAAKGKRYADVFNFT